MNMIPPTSAKRSLVGESVKLPTVEKCMEKTFVVWSMRIKMMLQCKEHLWKITEGSYPKPQPYNAVDLEYLPTPQERLQVFQQRLREIEDWEKKDKDATHFIKLSLDDDHLTAVINAQTAAETWRILHTNHQPAGRVAK